MPFKKLADNAESDMSVSALNLLRNVAKDFGTYWAKDLDKTLDPKFVLVIHPKSFILKWFDLREVFAEAFKEALGIKGNIIIKIPGEKDRYYSDVAKTFVMDEMDRHPALVEATC